jgi:hypothetical protein
MSLYKDASLVMLPTAYKDGKLYSVRPTDGSGDFTFSRGTTATRVASSGYIEKGRENVLLNSVWDGIGTNVPPTSWTNGFTSGNYESASSSFGGNNGIRFYGTSARRYVSQIPSFSGIMALSIYVESVTTADEIRYVLNQIGGTELFYLEDSSVVANTTSILAGKTYTLVFNTSGTTEIRIGGGVTGSRTYDFTLSVPQLEQGLVRTDYIETGASTAQAGILEDMPRLDYSGGATCPSLLLEPQRTNLMVQSEYYGSQTINNATLTHNYATSPEGVLNATRLNQSGTDYGNIRFSAISYSNGVDYTHSIFVKKDSKDYIIFREFASSSVGGVRSSWFNLNDLAWETSPSAHTTDFEDYGNGWIRLIVTFNAGNTFSRVHQWGHGDADNSLVVANSGNTLFYGNQVESSASYPTSYIPTYGASVTRSVDDVNEKTGVSNLIGQSEGTLFLDFVANDEDALQIIYQVRTTGSSNVGQIDFRIQGGNLRALGNDAGTAQFNISAGAAVAGTRYKCAVRYANNDVAFYVNGVLKGSDTNASFSSSALQQVSFSENTGTFLPSVSVHQAILFPTGLTNTELASLTTL